MLRPPGQKSVVVDPASPIAASHGPTRYADIEGVRVDLRYTLGTHVMM